MSKVQGSIPVVPFNPYRTWAAFEAVSYNKTVATQGSFVNNPNSSNTVFLLRNSAKLKSLDLTKFDLLVNYMNDSYIATSITVTEGRGIFVVICERE